MKNYFLIGVVGVCAVAIVVAYVLTQQSTNELTTQTATEPPATSQPTTPEPEPQQKQIAEPQQPTPESSGSTMIINNAVVALEVADTPAKRTQGLSGRVSLPQNSGMLFIFDAPHTPSFWMYKMNFALDFVWIRDSIIVDITENVPPPQPATPDSQLPLYSPNTPADMMLELNAGWVVQNGGKNALLNQPVIINLK